MTSARPAQLGVLLAAGAAGAVALGVLLAERFALGVGAVAAVVYALIVLRSPVVAVALWIPAFSISFIPVGNALLWAGFPAAGLAILVAYVRGEIHPRLADLHWGWAALVGLLLTWVALTMFWARDGDLVVGELWKAGLAVFTAAAIVLVVRTRGQLLWIVGALAAGPALSAAIGLFGGARVVGFAAGTNTFGRLAGGSGDANQLAAGLVPAIALAAGLLLAARSRGVRTLAIGCLTLGVIGVAASQSRGGVIALTVVAVTLIVLLRGARLPVVLVVLAGLAVGLMYLVSSPQALDRITDFDGEGTGRAQLWRIAADVARDHPLGAGLNNFRAVAPTYAMDPGEIVHLRQVVERPVVVHNTYLQFLAETGPPGLALFLSVVAGSLAAAARAARRFARAGEAGLALLARSSVAATIGFLVASFFVSFGFSYRMWTLLALGPALLTVACARRDAPAGPGDHAPAS
jgi:O-antigen ligase